MIEIRSGLSKRSMLSDGSVGFGNGVIGPSEEDRLDFNGGKRGIPDFSSIKKRALAGAALVGGTFGVGRAIDAISFGASATGYLKPMIETHPDWILAGVFAASVPVTVWSAIQDVKLLKNENIAFSPNGWADFVYYAFRKPSRARDIVTAIAPRLVTLDYFRIWGALHSQQMLEAVVAAKVTSTIVEAGKNVVELAALKTVGKEVTLFKRAKPIKSRLTPSAKTAVILE